MKKRNVFINNSTIIITGIAGFIGGALALHLLKVYDNVRIIGVDNLNDYYDINLKRWRLEQIKKGIKDREKKAFIFIECDISNKEAICDVFLKYKPDVVVHLAAQAGVRNSIDNPEMYISSNVVGFFNIIEACRNAIKNNKDGLSHFVFASSSSVYGNNRSIPYNTTDKTDTPVSLYAATKKSDELLAYAYSRLYGIPTTGLRFFTVYGPAGRPDMAYYQFTNKLLKGEVIKLYNFGECERDFTFVDDIVEGITRVIQVAPVMNECIDGVPYSLYNIGNSHPENLKVFTTILCDELKRANLLGVEFDLESHMELVPLQMGDVSVTFADVSELERDFGFKPETSLKSGLEKFVKWYKNYYS